jgi:hypothetical protein
MRISKATGRRYTVPLESRIDRAFWSREVVYDGDEVKIHIETSFVQDGAAATVTILERPEKGEDSELTVLESSDLANGELILDYTIELPELPAGDGGAGHVPETRNLVFVVSFTDYELTNEDDPPVLPVDAGAIRFSE